MGPKYPCLRAKEVIRILKQSGFEERMGKGSHRIFVHPITLKKTIISVHPGEIPIGTLKAIERQSGIQFNLQ
jgi:predicted RNA binding protein YcfA (HicA-like mRNA interferase family)